MKKLYTQPELELEEIKLIYDVLSTSGDVEETLNPNEGTEFNPGDDFEELP